MENKEVPEEIMVDYVAKESTQSSILNAFLAWGIAIAYTAYTFYSIMTEFSPEQLGGEAACGLFLDAHLHVFNFAGAYVRDVSC